MSPVIDFASVKGPELLPEGQYLGKVVHAEEGLSSNQQPKIDLRYEIMAPEAFAGRQVFDVMSFHPDVLWRAKASLAGLGFAEDFSGEVTADSLVGKEAALVIIIEKSTKTDDDGNPYPDRNKVKKVQPAAKYGTKAPAAAAALEEMEIGEAPSTRKPGRNK